MGAACSVLTDFPGPLSSQTCMIMGIDGKPKTKQFTPPLNCLLGNSTFAHHFLLMPECPLPLLGRDLLTKFQTIVQAGDPHREDNHQEKQLLLAGGVYTSPKPEGVSILPHLSFYYYFFTSLLEYK